MRYLLYSILFSFAHFLTLFLAPMLAEAQSWPCYAQDPGGQRYSALQQISTANVSRLTPAWTFRTGELETYAGTGALQKAAFEATPILIGRTLFFSTPSDRVFAIDATTGAKQWVYDPHVNLHRDMSELSSRGVAAWQSGDTLRIYIGTIDGRLIALDGHSGLPVSNFGDTGAINLRAGYSNEIQETSPPAVIGDRIIIGSSMGDNQRYDQPPGVVRAYDVRNGRLLWSWNPIPQDPADSAYATWQGPKAHNTGAANTWSIKSADPDRDLIFVPTSCPSPDYYGGERLGSNRYANSLVALRASTGARVWSFQVVHHDLWDFDIAAQPILIDFKGKPAVVVGTKMGFIYVLDRLTGAPLLPVTEQPVPASTVKGEQAWPTQPFPSLPRLGLQTMSPDSAWGPTPEDLAEAKTRIAKYRYEGPFTPPSYEGTIMAPGNVGGINWSGMCYNPSTGMLYTNVNCVAAVIRMIPREQVDSLEKESGETLRAETGRQRGTPYVMKRNYLFKTDARGMVMQTRPPWGTIAAINLRTGKKTWEVPLGYQLDPAKYPDAKKWGSLNFGGAISTAGNLVFVAASMDGHLRAFDSRTGQTLWEYGLPASAQAAPMTYSLDGRQYVVICAGGHGKLGTKMGDYVMAFRLP